MSDVSEPRLIITNELMDMAKKGFCHDRKGGRSSKQATYITGINLHKENGDLVIHFADSSGENMQFMGLSKIETALKGLPVERANVRLPADGNPMHPALVLPAEFAERAVAALRKMEQLKPSGEDDVMRPLILEALNNVEDKVRVFVEKKRDQSNMAKVIDEKKKEAAAAIKVELPKDSYAAEVAASKADPAKSKGAQL